MAEFQAALNSMALGKSSGPDGVVVEFYKHFRDIIGKDFTTMIRDVVNGRALLLDMYKGLIVLLPKEIWCRITLLNIAYKIFAKTLQIRLQKLLPEVIHGS